MIRTTEEEDVNIASTIARIAAVLATVSALTALVGVAQAGASRPPSMSKAEYRALMLRSDALNEKHGLGSQRAVSQGMTAAGYRALMLRSQALNTRYGLDKQIAAAVTPQLTNSTRGFAWGAFGIGAAVMFGLALLAGGFFVRHGLLATRRGLTPYRTT
jgi:hypothetical protein